MNTLTEKQIPYTLERSRHARSIRIIVRRTGEVRIVAPSLVPEFIVNRFISQKTEWVVRVRNKFLEHPVTEIGLLFSRRSRKDYMTHKVEALKVITERVRHFNTYYKLPYSKISIRNQSSRWGSCTKSGHLSFNYKLLLVAPELRDYVVVHEICHLKHLNHAKVFWDLVAEMVPEHKTLRKRLRGVL